MSPSVKIKITIADDHELFRNGLSRMLKDNHEHELIVVSEASNGQELINQVGIHKPALVITDIRMPVIDGYQATSAIKQLFPDTSVIALSMFTDSNNIIQMLQAGAIGYVVKTTAKEEIVDAIKSVNRGTPYYCSSISEKIYGHRPPATSGKHKKNVIDLFSSQEIRIMQLICRQLSTKEIADSMGLAIRTVENYRYNIQYKTASKNMVGVALFAVVNNLVNFNDLRPAYQH